MDLVGSNLGQFQIVEQSGKGGMATVYKAYQPSLQRYVAIKVLAPSLAEDMDLVKRFLREARSAAALHHSNVIVIHDVGSEENTHYIVSAFLEGLTLADLLKQSGALPSQRVLAIARQVASALDYAHSQGFIHRDIKPSNIMVDPSRDDHATLMDFGLVRVAGSSRITQTGFIMGTPDYMSPEQAKGAAIDHRTDIYSLGVTMYHMLTGTIPFIRPTPHAVLMAHILEEPPQMSLPDRLIPPEIEAVVRKSLAKEPSARYEWAGDMIRDLDLAVSSPATFPSLSIAGLGTEPPTTQVEAALPPTVAIDPSDLPIPVLAPPARSDSAVNPASTSPPGPPRYAQTPPPGPPRYAQTPLPGPPRYAQTPLPGVATPVAAPVPAPVAPRVKRGWLWPVLIGVPLALIAALVLVGVLLVPKTLPRLPAVARLTQAAQTATAAAMAPTATATVVAEAPVIEFFAITPQQPVRGQEVDLSWRVRGPTSRVEISANFQTISALPAEGHLVFQVSQMTLFVLTARYGDLEASQSIEVPVIEPTATQALPTATLTRTATAAATSTSVPETAAPAETPTVPPTETAAATATTPPTAAPTAGPTSSPRPAQPTASAPPGVLFSFESWGTWKRGAQPYGELVQTQEQVKSGRYAAKLSYDFPDVADDFVVFANQTAVRGTPNTVSAWVYGDGSGHFLNIWIQDAAGQVWSVHLGKVGAAGWQQMTGRIATGLPWPSGPVFGPDNGAIDYPIRFYGIVLDRPDVGVGAGKIYIDDISVTTSDAPVPAPATTPAAGGPAPGQIGRIVFTVQAGEGYALYSTDPSWDRMVKVGDTNSTHSTCGEPSSATTLDGVVIGLAALDRCPIAGTVDQCTSPNGQFRVNTNRQGNGFSVTLWRVSDNQMLEAIYQGRLNITPGLNWAPDSSHFLFTVDQSVYRANVGQAGYSLVIPFKGAEWPVQYTADGLHIYYPKPVAGNISDIFLANPDGSGERNLTNAPIAVKLCPRWRR